MGLAVVLGFIGVKLIMHAVHENTLPFINGGEPVHAVPEIPIWLSLAVIVGTLVVATVASLAKTRRDEAADVLDAQREELRAENVGGQVRE
jgi:tellurite resistance protein TerC